MDKDGKMFVEIRMDTDDDLFADIRNLQLPPVPIKYEEDDHSEPVILLTKQPTQKKKKSKKPKKSSLMSIGSDIDLVDDISEVSEEEQSIMDIEDIFSKRKKDDDDDDIVKTQKKGYKKLKDNKNVYKKEFAEEITLLYNLLDETTKFGKALEKDLTGMRTTKVRGTSKYSNDLAELVLSSKQTKLNILKEIAGVKKTIADLAQKSEKNNKNDEDSANKNERLASAYFKNILTHGRSNFLRSMDGYDEDDSAPPDSSFGYSDKEEYDYSKRLEERLDGIVNPYRSDEGTKYIEYEKRGVKIEVHKCVDTGEWEFVAVDKHGEEIEDYPVPTKKTAGRMRFSDDGSYCTDSLGRIYKVHQFYIPDEDSDDDEDE